MVSRKIINQEIQESFHWIDLSLQDFRKVLPATDEVGNGANFLVALCGLAITEIIAKLYYPYTFFKTKCKGKRLVRTRGYTVVVKGKREKLKPDSLKRIDTKLAVFNFYRNCFKNKRYATLAYLIWEVFRNGHIHLFRPKRIRNIPIPEFDNSAASGVKWVDIKLLVKYSNYRKDIEEENLKFVKMKIKGKDRPVFIFIPHIYYFDLCEAVQNFKTQLNTNQNLRIRFHKAHQLLMQAKNLDLIRDKEKDIIVPEIKKLL